MKKQIKVTCLKDIKTITGAASPLHDAIQVMDASGAVANAKSILGLLSLDYSSPVSISSDSANALNSVLEKLANSDPHKVFS